MEQFQYGKKEANFIKGIAIVMMFTHHFFRFLQWINDANMYHGITINGIIVEQEIAFICKICVGLFAFTSGYAMFVNKNRYEKWSSCAQKAFKFLVQYWVVVAVFLVIGILLKEPLPTFKVFLLQSFGIHTMTGFDWSYNTGIHSVFAWYVSFYLLFLLLHPLMRKLSRFNFWIDNIIYAVVLHGTCFVLMRQFDAWGGTDDLLKIVSSFATWGNVGIVGFLFAKYDMFAKMDNAVRKYIKPSLLALLDVIMILAIMALRYQTDTYLTDTNTITLDMIWAPILIYAFINFMNYICVYTRMNMGKIIEKGFVILGKYSMNMWFLHGIFFTPKKTLQWIAYFPKYPILILIWTLFLMFWCSVLIARLQNYILGKVTR